MIHLHDLAALFLAAYENPSASGRYYGVVDSWHWHGTGRISMQNCKSRCRT
jgi:hypothetical protein